MQIVVQGFKEKGPEDWSGLPQDYWRWQVILREEENEVVVKEWPSWDKQLGRPSEDMRSAARLFAATLESFFERVDRLDLDVVREEEFVPETIVTTTWRKV